MTKRISSRRSARKVCFASCLVVLFALLLAACQKNTNPLDSTSNAAATIMPLVVGNQWTYIDSSFSSTGTLLLRDSSKLAITGTTTIQYGGASTQVYHWNWLNVRTGVADDWRWLTRVESDGRYMFGGMSSKGTFVLVKTLSEKFPVSVGESWQRYNIVARTDSTFRVQDTLLVRCTALDEPFNTLVGTLKCVVYYYQQRPVTSTAYPRDTWLYYAPNIGYVGLIGRENGVLVFKKTLISYQLK